MLFLLIVCFYGLPFSANKIKKFVDKCRLCVVGIIARVSKSLKQIFQNVIPGFESSGAELDPFSFEFSNSVLVSVVYEEVSLAEMLAVGDDNFLVEYIVKMSGDPDNLVAPC